MFFLKQLFRAREHMQLTQGEPDAPMTFLEHLEELRRTIIRMLLTLIVSMILCFGLAQEIMEILRYPAECMWTRHEAERLPDTVSANDWMQAKQLAAVSATLSTCTRENLLKHMPPKIQELAAVVPLLRAAVLLPEEKRQLWLQQSAESPQQLQLATQLTESGAELKTAEQQKSLRLMGAFRPGEAFMLSLQLAFFAGLILAFPILVIQLMRFIIPGLHEHERRMMYKSVTWGFFLFLGGCLFAYFGVLPRVLSFFYNYSLGLGIENDWRIGYYLSFAVKLIFIFGVIFELPVIVIPLIKMGILNYTLMKRTRGYALIACFAAALLLAPAPDPATMVLMALPMYALYELCVIFAWLQHRRTPITPAP